MYAIEATDLRKRYGDKQAVDGVSFSVNQGEIFGLLGPNGAGKSTTVRMLITLTRPDSGSAIVAGHDVLRDPVGVRRSIGCVAQASGTDKHSTGRENLLLQGQLHRVPKKELGKRIDDLLDWVGLTDAGDKIVRTYSGGMKRRLDIAMGLVNNPSVLFLDEPTTGLDPEARAALWEDLLRLKEERHLAVLLTTHYLDEADQLCDQLAIVDHGRIVTEGTPAELKAAVQGDAVTLEVDKPTAEVATLLRPITGVIDVIPNGRSVIARVNEGATMIPSLVLTLERSGVRIGEVTLSRPSLDDVYLIHTGHRLTAAQEAELAKEAEKVAKEHGR